MFCQKCGAEVGEAKFCPECGEKVIREPEATEAIPAVSPEVQDVPQAVPEAPAEEAVTAYIPEEADTVEGAYLPPVDGPEMIIEPESTQAKKKGGKKILAIVLIILVIAAAVGAGLFWIKNHSSSEKEDVKYTLYVKDNSLYYMDPDAEEPVLVTESFLKDYDDVDITYLGYFDTFVFADNNKKLFYGQKLDLEEGTFDLYCKMTDKPEEDPIKLAEDVVNFSVSGDGTSVIYLDSEGNFYTHNLTDRDKILSEVDDYWISDDCLSIAFLSADGGLYTKTVEGEKEKIDSDVTEVYKVSDDLQSIYYLKDEALFVKSGEADKVKIDSGVNGVVKILDNGSVYYTKADEETTSKLTDYIDYPKELVSKDKATIKAGYYDNCPAYNEARYRTVAFDILAEKKITIPSSKLFYYDGENADAVNAQYVECYCTSDDALIIKSYDNAEVNPVSIKDFVDTLDEQEGFRADCTSTQYYTDYYFENTYNEYGYFDDFEDVILGAFENDAVAYYVKDGKSTLIDADSAENYVLSEDGNSIYYMSDVEEKKETANIYLITVVEDGTLSAGEVYAEDISSEMGFDMSDIGLVYFKDLKDESADMYVDSQLIEYDIHRFYILSNGSIVYFTDVDDDYETGTAYLYTDGEKIKISDSISLYAFEDSECNILYYKDYSDSTNKGDLYVYKNGESVKVDYDVSKAVTIDGDSKYRGFISWYDIDLDWDYEDYDEEDYEDEYEGGYYA